MDAYTWADSDGDSARLMAYRDFAPDCGDDESALVCITYESDSAAGGADEALVCIETRGQAEAIIAWLKAHFGIE